MLHVHIYDTYIWFIFHKLISIRKTHWELGERSHIYHDLVEFILSPTILFDLQNTSMLKPTIILSSSTCFFHVLFGLPFFLWSSTSMSNALIKTWLSPLLYTWPCQWILFVIVIWYIVLFKPNIKSLTLFFFSTVNF